MKLTQQGGEGKQAYKSTKSDMSLSQQGGEGKSVSTKSDISYRQKSDYAGPGRHLKTMSS